MAPIHTCNVLDIVAQWVSKWRLEINMQKTKVVYFRPKNTPATHYSSKTAMRTISGRHRQLNETSWFNDLGDDEKM